MRAFQACADRQELARVAEGLLDGFAGRKRRLFFFDEMGMTVEERRVFLDNPVWQRFVATHAALSEATVVDEATWRRYCPRADHGHVLVGPVVARGKLVGAVAVTRLLEDPPFSQDDLAAMNHFCLHLSTRVAELTGRELPELTPRETEVARAVCRGLRNREVAHELTVTEHTVKQNLKAIFRKLNVRSRAELVALLR